MIFVVKLLIRWLASLDCGQEQGWWEVMKVSSLLKKAKHKLGSWELVRFCQNGHLEIFYIAQNSQNDLWAA
jgi:hypothetical protein